MNGALRATHAIELSFLWDWARQSPMGLAGSNPPEDLGPAMRAYWVNFARAGVPSADGEPDWPTYDTSRRATLVLDSERRIAHDLDGDVRAFWFD